MREAVLRRIEEGKPIDRDFREELSALTGAGKTTITQAVREATANPAAAWVALPWLAPTMQRRYEGALRTAKSQLRKEITAEVTTEIRRIWDEVYLPSYNERIIRADRIIAGYNGFMSREEFRKIRACLHPDHNTFMHAAEALRIFSALEAVLVKPDVAAFSGPPLPSTVTELLAQRKKR